MNNDQSAKIIARALIALILGALLLIVYGLVKTTKDCQEQGGAYVRSTTGYDCVEKEGR